MAAAKRWMSVATPDGDGWRVRIEPVGEATTLLARLRREAGPHPVAFGVDAPIGLPEPFAALHLRSFGGFAPFIGSLAPDDPFFSVCDRIEEVGPERPFYPRSVIGAPRRAAHAARLGVMHADALLRRCDLATPTRPRAATMFWTLGPNQVGKAAISLWRAFLPTVPGDCLWPHCGRLHALLEMRGLVVAETYPAEAMRQLGLAMGGSKRRQMDRAALAPALSGLMAAGRLQPDAAVATALASGFGADAAGEDRFDSLVGLLGLMQVWREGWRDRVPAAALPWEGWILGQPPG